MSARGSVSDAQRRSQSSSPPTSDMSMMRIAVAGTGGLARLIAHYIDQETSHQVVFLSRTVRKGSTRYLSGRTALADTITGATATHRRRLSSLSRQLLRHRVTQVRPARHRHGHLHRHRTQPSRIDQGCRRRTRSTLRTRRVRRSTKSSEPERAAGPWSSSRAIMASVLRAEHPINNLCLRHSLRKIPAWRTAAHAHGHHIRLQWGRRLHHELPQYERASPGVGCGQ